MAVDSGTYTDDTLFRRKKIAEAMLGDPKTPIRHWAEGLAELGKGAIGGYQFSKAEDAERAKEDQGNAQLYAMAGIPAPPGAQRESQGGFQRLAALMSGGGTAQASPVAAPVAANPAVAPSPTAAAPGKIYSNDEPSPLDPPSGVDRKAMIATILGEAGNQAPAGQNAVASVIRNRAVNGGYGGDTPAGVVTAPNQFEPWNTEAGRSKMAAAASDPNAAASADRAITMAYGEGGLAPNDPTAGAKNFISPKVQAALGRPTPAWASGSGQDIGDHRFFGGAPQEPGQAPYQVAGPPTAAPQGPVAQAMTPPTMPTGDPSGLFANVPKEQMPGILAGLTSKDPTLKALAVQKIGQYTKQDDPVSIGGKLVTKGGKVIYEGAEEKPKWGVVGKDKYGQPVYGYPPPREEAAKTAEKPAAPEQDMAGLTGKEYLETLKKDDPKMESQVRAVLEGRAPYPTGMLLKTPYGQQLAAHVTQADPSFESGNATARVKTRNEFMTGGVGSPAGQITAGNTALQHAGEMSDALERVKEGGGLLRGLGNAGIPVLSYLANEAKNKSVQGTPEGAALNDFMTAKNHFSEEVTKFYAGSAGSEAERTRALANLDAAKSLPELRSAIKTEVNLMQGKVNALQDRWKNGMGPLVPEFPLIQQKSQEAIDRVIQRHQASEQPPTNAAPAKAASPQTATNPQTGERLMLQNGQWVPMK